MTTNSIARQPLSIPNAKGTQDGSGWGLLGLALGIVIGFAVAFYFIVPLFPKDRSTLTITIMTTLVTAMMTIGGTGGYLALRRKSPGASTSH